MRSLMTALLLATAVLALTACGGTDAGDGDTQGATPAADGATGGPTTITGTLAGDAQLEGGCVWVDTADGRYEVRWPEGWHSGVDPIQVRGPDGEVVAGEGDEIRVTGEVRRDVATVCQVGTVLDAADVTAGR